MRMTVIQPTKDQQSRCVTYDFTVGLSLIPPVNEYLIDGTVEDTIKAENIDLDILQEKVALIAKGLRIFCKAFVFQLERAPTTGWLHFQGRFKLKVKNRINFAIKSFGDNITTKCKISITATENSKNFFYVMKEDSRESGPWSDSDNIGKVKPWQLTMFPNPLPFQETYWQILKERDLRTIHYGIDPFGQQGKTIAAQEAVFQGFAQYLPYSDNYKDLMQAAYCVPSPAYIFDLPRALPKKNMKSFYSAIENIKDGWFFDLRNTFRHELRDRPSVFVWSNKWPNTKLLSADRWVFWKIVDKQLIRYTDEEVQAAQTKIRAKLKLQKQRQQQFQSQFH